MDVPDMITELKQSMKELSGDDFDKVESILLELFRMRRGKIVKLADSIKLNSDIYNQLTVEENIFYKTIYDNSKEFENQVRGNTNE